MFEWGNIAEVAKAKSIFSGDTPTPVRISNGLDLLGQVGGMAQSVQNSKLAQAPAMQAKERIKATPAAQNLKLAAEAVASYYTGGLSGLAKNVGGAVLSRNNPQAAGLAGMGMKALGI
jgi:hypothetical protein